MTKAECVIEDLGFVRDRSGDLVVPKVHAPGEYTVRVFTANLPSGTWRAECESYYGTCQILQEIPGGWKSHGDWEYRYEGIAGLIS